MITLPISASAAEIKALVVRWSELLAEERFAEALELFPHSHWELEWTPDTLRAIVRGYGVLEPDGETLKAILARHGVDEFRVTTLVGRADFQEILDDKIDVERTVPGDAPSATHLGTVHYNDVPLSGMRSDLTARFDIIRVGADRLTLEFLDLHVM